MKKTKLRARWLGPAGVLMIGLHACRTTEAPPPVLPPPAAVMAEGMDIGSVASLNRQEDYVILRCTVLPYEAEELKVYRGREEVGAVRVAGPKKPPFFAADIVGGNPARGDRVKRAMAPTRDRRVP